MNNSTIGGTSYGFVQDFKDDPVLRHGFNALAKATFSFDFEDYYQDGYWEARYIPHALTHQGRVVANVSVNRLDFWVQGEWRRYLQLGTVMTDQAYRGRGLSRYLLEAVLDRWKNRCDLVYLFANDTVLDFYPKFGFVKKNEYQWSRELCPGQTGPTVRHLNLDTPEDRALLFRLTAATRPFSQLTAIPNTGLVMFYATSFYKESFYYIPEMDAAVFARYPDNTLELNDIFCPRELDLEAVIAAMTMPSTCRVALGFTPIHTEGFRCAPHQEEGDTLFVLGQNSVFDAHNLMLPLLSHS